MTPQKEQYEWNVKNSTRSPIKCGWVMIDLFGCWLQCWYWVALYKGHICICIFERNVCLLLLLTCFVVRLSQDIEDWKIILSQHE